MSGRILAVTMPKWGMTMTEGQVAGWLAEEGDAIEPGREIIEIETTKITNVMEASGKGILRRRLIGVGTTAPVGSLLGVIAADDVTDSDIDAFVATYAVAAQDAQGEGAETARVIDALPHRLNVMSMGAGDGIPLIVIHGFGGDLNSWMFNQADLAVDRPVHAIDLPAHGQSSLTHARGGVPELAGAVVALLDALGIARTHIMGHSLGGAIALYLAMKQQERIFSATLVCPGGLGPEINMDYINGFVAADRRKSMQDVLAHLFADPGAVRRQMVEETLKFKRRDGVPEALSRIAAANFVEGHQAGGMRAGLKSLKVPTLVVWGAEDRIIPATQALGLPNNLNVHVLENAGHMPMMEQAARFNALVKAFLDQAERA